MCKRMGRRRRRNSPPHAQETAVAGDGERTAGASRSGPAALRRRRFPVHRPGIVRRLSCLGVGANSHSPVCDEHRHADQIAVATRVVGPGGPGDREGRRTGARVAAARPAYPGGSAGGSFAIATRGVGPRALANRRAGWGDFTGRGRSARRGPGGGCRRRGRRRFRSRRSRTAGDRAAVRDAARPRRSSDGRRGRG